MLAQVEIYDADFSDRAYNAVTNTWSGTAINLYTGKARIQPLTNVSDEASEYNPSVLQSVRVQIPLTSSTPDIRPNHRLKVTSAPENPALEDFLYIVMGVLNSSNAWERTLMCRVDTELNPNA
jgi:hypothetical protein